MAFKLPARLLLLSSSYFKSLHREIMSHSRTLYAEFREVKENEWLGSERELKFDNNPDVFGTLSHKTATEREIESMPEEADDVEVRTTYGREGRRRLLVNDYAKMIKQYVKEKRLLDAIEVLEEKMIKEDNVKLQNYFYNLLIDACAKAGYAKKAFKLYNQMKKRGLKVGLTTYTSLFNACALSSVPGDGLKRATALRELLQEKAINLNQTNYHAMIKAFGWCGDLLTAFSLVDEMVEKKIPVTADTFAFLIQACISDKKAGFRHALIVWRKMLQRGLKPHVHNYNLMLRCARDCDMGEPEAARQLLEAVISKATTESLESSKQKMLGSGKSVMQEGKYNPAESSIVPSSPNLLARTSDFSSVMDIGEISSSQDRFILIGSSSGFLADMMANNIQPDIKTVTQILDLLPPNGRSEVEIMDFMQRYKIKMDTGFCNNLIKRRNMRGDYLGSVEIVKVMKKRNLKPDLLTYGSLAVACRTLKEAEQLIIDIAIAGYRVNVEIAGGLVNAGHHTMDIGIISLALDSLTRNNVQPNSRLIAAVDKFVNTVRTAIQDEKDFGAENRKMSASFLKEFAEFESNYSQWLTTVEIDKRDDRHPWMQFKKSFQKENEAAAGALSNN